jgi:two-component system sensor histidine kinase RstB
LLARFDAMPPKFFLKLYARLAGLTLLVLMLCLTLFWGLNSVREKAWQERYPEPLMRWLAEIPEPASYYHWLDSLYDFRRFALEQSDLPRLVRERLEYGQVVAVPGSDGRRLLVLDQRGEVLSLSVRDTYRDVSEAVALIVWWHLDGMNPETRLEAMEQLSARLELWVEPIEDQSQLPPEEVLGRVADGRLALYRKASGQANVVLRLSDGKLVNLQMPPPFSVWSLPVVFLMVLVSGSVLALALFLAMREVDHSLRSVESVAVRIARGELGARVEAGDSTLVSRLAGSFNSMAEHIQRLVGVQQEMIHAVSHELRTPVARIRFGVQMLEGCEDQDTLQRQLDGIDGDIQELDELIDEILTYARLEQGGPVFSLTETSVTGIVRQVVEEQQRVRQDLVIEALIGEETEYWSLSDIEPRYIHRAIQNLVGNAGRYAHSHVRVVCHIDEDNCRVDVEDDGPGIPEEDWEKVFTAFARLDDSRTRTSGGYGLGLSIVRRILYWHGGQAFVGRSEALGGAKFSLVWPRKKSLDAIV